MLAKELKARCATPQGEELAFVDANELISFCSSQDLERMCKAGLKRVEVLNPMDLSLASGRPSETALRTVGALRDLTALGLEVVWRLAAIEDAIVPFICHLSPPASARNASEAVAAWQADFRFGKCYWRQGPGFVVVLDKRDARSGHQFVLDDEASRLIFAAATEICPTNRLHALSSETAADLEREGLILSSGGWSIVLPYRLRYWPVPFTAI